MSFNTPRHASFSEMSMVEQREYLQALNPDKLAWVFDVELKYLWDFELKTLPNILACYPNQLNDGQIELPEDFPKWNIVIVDMWALRKWNIEVIAWNNSSLQNIKKPVLLSPWVIEYWEDKTSWKKYTQTVLRDWGQMNHSAGITSLADANERTTAAWRNFSWKLREDLEMENAEESPFLMQDSEWNYVLVTHDLGYQKSLIASIRNFLENKYLQPNQEWFQEVKRAFEIKFKWVKYEDLWDILRNIIAKESFAEYAWEEWDIEWLGTDNIKLEWTDWGVEDWYFYVFHDKVNNTIEYRAIRKITWFPEWLKPVWRIPLRLFLESQNQDPSFKRVDRIWKYWFKDTRLVPTINDISEKVSGIYQKRRIWVNEIHYWYIEFDNKFKVEERENWVWKSFMVGEESFRVLQDITWESDLHRGVIVVRCEKELRDELWRIGSCWYFTIEIQT